MSLETMEWLNSMTLIGFTEKRGNAWHYRESLQSGEPNHYVGAIPVEDVERRLFNWTADSTPIYIKAEDGTLIEVPNRKAIVTSDDSTVLGVFSDNYKPHQYQNWLVDNVASILDADLGIGSAGLLRNRGQAWVSVEVPDTITTPEGVEFRPNLLAATSFDGSLATVYKRTAQIVVCDNTLAAGLQGAGETYRVKHTKYSEVKISDARDALAIVYSIVDDFSAEIARLTQMEVTDKIWGKVLDAIVPLPEEEGRSRTMRENKRDELNALYNHDLRVTPWRGTAFGVVQAFNTFNHHVMKTRGDSSRVQRNQEAALKGTFAKEDEKVISTVRELISA